jgi:hypothetical protein
MTCSALILLSSSSRYIRAAGRLAGRFLAATAFRPGWTGRLVESLTRANRQPAFGFYVSNARTGQSHTVGLLVLTLSGDRISAMTRFDSTVLDKFGLPSTVAR